MSTTAALFCPFCGCRAASPMAVPEIVFCPNRACGIYNVKMPFTLWNTRASATLMRHPHRLAVAGREKLVLDFISQYINEHDYAPTIREIGASCGIASTSHVQYILDKLQRSGQIIREVGKTRGLQVVAPY